MKENNNPLGWKRMKLKDILTEGSKERVEDTSKYQKLTIKLNFNGMEKSKVRDNMADRRPFYIRRKGEIVIGKQNYFNGSIAILPEELDGGICSNAIMSFYTQKGYNNKYIYYMLSDTSFINKRSFIANGTGQKELSEKDFLNFEVIVPPLEEQNAIVMVIDKVDNIIKKYEELLNQNNQLNKCLFEKMIYNEKKISKLGDITIKITDGSHNPPKHFEEQTKYKMLSAQNIGEDGLNYENIRYLSYEDYLKENRRTNVQKNDILYSIVGTIGKTYIVKDEKNIVFQRSVAILKLKDDINPYYIKYLLNSKYIKKQIDKISKGNAQKGIYLDDLKKLKVKVPYIEDQNKLAKILNQFDKQNIALKKAIENYKNLKKGLMQKLLTGKVRVKI